MQYMLLCHPSKTARTKPAGIYHASIIHPNARHTDSMSWGGKKQMNSFPFTGTENVKGIFCTYSKQKSSKRIYSYNCNNTIGFQISWMWSHSSLWNHNIFGLQKKKRKNNPVRTTSAIKRKHHKSSNSKRLHDWAKTAHSVLAQTCRRLLDDIFCCPK